MVFLVCNCLRQFFAAAFLVLATAATAVNLFSHLLLLFLLGPVLLVIAAVVALLLLPHFLIVPSVHAFDAHFVQYIINII